MSPFEVLYGYAPKHFGIDILDSTPVPILGEWLQEKAVMQALVQQHLFRAQHRMKVSADKNRSDRSFQVGDQVYVKLQPYVQSSLAPRANQKLAFRFLGHFQLLLRWDLLLTGWSFQLLLLSTPCSMFPSSRRQWVLQWWWHSFLIALTATKFLNEYYSADGGLMEHHKG